MGYLRIWTRFSVTATIGDWEAMAKAIPLQHQGRETLVPPAREDIVFAVSRKLEELRTQQGRRTNASWDYDCSLTLENLTEDQVDAIRQAWESR